MPLRAISGQQNINAFECTDVEWAEIKQAYRDQRLVMPCCTSRAIPKTSKLGNYFFSHARRGECTSAPESAEHIYLKTIIAKAAVEAGWSVVTECSGSTPDGEMWVADVCCERHSGRVALEAQVSYQTVEVLGERQEIYRKSGVRAAWFALSSKFKDNYLSPSKEIPFFRVKPFTAGSEPAMSDFEASLSEFVGGLLAKRVVWRVDPLVYHIHYLNDICWKCKGQVKQVFGSSIDVHGESAKTVPNMSTVLHGFSKFVTNEELRSLSLNTIGKFEHLKGNAPGFPYCNQCIHCGAPQNNYYVMRKIKRDADFCNDIDPDLPFMGTQEFVSTREGTGYWQYEK